MTVPGEIVELELFTTSADRIMAVTGDAEGKRLEIMCFQKLNPDTAIGIQCKGGFAVGKVMAATSESDGLMAYQIEICEAVVNPEMRLHQSWKLRIERLVSDDSSF